MIDIESKLESLVNAFENIGIEVSDNLRPGLSDYDLNEWSISREIELPVEVKALFRWRNGSADRFQGTEKLLVFRDNVFVGLDDYDEVIGNCRAFVSAYEEGGGNFPFPIEKSIPIAEFEGNAYVVPSTPISNKLESPVVVVGEDLGIHFLSISSMLDTAIAWVRDPKYSLGDFDLEDELHAWEKFNPGVFEFKI